MAKKTINCRQRRSAKDISRDAAVPAEDRVQIVLNQHKPRIFYAAIEVVVITVAIGERCFAVVQQSIDREESQPLVHVDHAADFFDVDLIRRGVGHNITQFDQIRPVIFGGIGPLEIAVTVGIRISPSVLQVGRAGVSHALVGVAGAIVREVIVGIVAVDNLDMGV